MLKKNYPFGAASKMMAGLFAILLFSMGAIYFQKRLLALICWGVGIALSLLVFWHHVTDTLKINW